MILCKQCKRGIVGENYYLIDVRNEYFCSKNCLAAFAAEEKEKEDKKRLFDNIKRIFSVSFPNAQQLAEIKRYKEKENITYSQMASILHYIYDIKETSVYSNSLYLIPRYKEEARLWYLENKTRQERAKKMAEQNATVQIRKINKVNTSRDKRRVLTELNPEDV